MATVFEFGFCGRPYRLLFSCSIWMNKTREKISLHCNQTNDDSSDSPLLPPSVILNSPDASIDGSIRTSHQKTANQARQVYNRLRKLPASNRRHRRFVFGAIYEHLFPGFFEVDPKQGNFDLIVRLNSNQTSIIRVVMIDPDEGVGKDKLLPCLVNLGNSLKGSGNVRGAKVGDTGSMHGFGFKSATSKEEFKGSTDSRLKIQKCSTLMRNFMEDNLREELKSIVDVDKANGTHGILPYLAQGPGSRLMYSINLANAAHYDNSDTSISVGVWTEKKPGEAKNWYFILPNISHNGSAGVVIRLHHGVAITWDGRCIYHCTSKTEVGTDNEVYGCMWSSSK